jgi:PadR family transcriptional regulator PadR
VIEPLPSATARWEVQVRKGVLEFIALLHIRMGECYGYELITQIRKTVDLDVTEGTIYPLLKRLEREGVVSSRWVEVSGGAARKYYAITPHGERLVAAMQQSWLELSFGLQRLMVAR